MKPTDIKIDDYRTPDWPIEPMLYRRWSPRAMSGETLNDEEIMSLFEAARWAPSSYNAQHWRFLYTTRGSAHWEKYLGFLVEGNFAWAKNAGLLIVLVSRTTTEPDGNPVRTYSFDAGAAWQNIALQSSAMDLVSHGMQGFDYEKARTELNVPDDYSVEVMIAVGKPGEIDKLPASAREKETPNSRKPLADIIIEGNFRIE